MMTVKANPFVFVKPILTVLLVLIIVGVGLRLSPFQQVSAGERGLVLTWGAVQEDVLTEGLHFIFPVRDRLEIIDITVQKVEASATSASKDLQIVTTLISLNYHLDPLRVGKIFKLFRGTERSRIIEPSIQEAVKAATAKFTAEELITKRPEVRDEIKSELQAKLSSLSGDTIVIDEFNIVDFTFSDEFNRAIEQKVTAAQLALKAERDLDRIKIEAEQRVTQAKAEADALLLTAQAQAEALRLQKTEITPGLNEFKAIEKWDGVLPQVVTDSTPFIDLNRFAKIGGRGVGSEVESQAVN